MFKIIKHISLSIFIIILENAAKSIHMEKHLFAFAREPVVFNFCISTEKDVQVASLPL